MNPIKFRMRRLVIPLMLVVILISGVVFGLYKMRVDIPALNTTKVYAYLDILGVRAGHWQVYLVGQYKSRFQKHEEEAHEEKHQIVVTTPIAKDVTITQQYVCLIRSRRHIDVCALESGYLKAITVKEGQAVKKGDVMFEVKPILYQTRWEAEVAEMRLAELELANTKRLRVANAVSEQEVNLFVAKLARAQAKAAQSKAELDFAQVKAEFDGIIDRLQKQEGSLVKEGEILTTLSDNEVMWVYFNVPEKRYLEYMAEMGENKESPDIVLMLADQTDFKYPGKIDPAHNIGAIEAQFNPETGNIAFRADFPNPIGPSGRLLRHGQTGNVKVHRALKNAIVIPQRATFEVLDKRYVYVVDKDGVAHQRPFIVQYEQDDIFVVEKRLDAKDKKGLDENDKIILEGVRQVREGDTVKYKQLTREEAEKALVNQKQHAE